MSTRRTPRRPRCCGGEASQVSVESEAFSPLHVSSCRDTRSARVLRSFEAGHIDVNGFNAIVEMLGTAVVPGLMDSQAKHVAVASGGTDLVIRVPTTTSFHDKIWDQAAGSLIATMPVVKGCHHMGI